MKETATETEVTAAASTAKPKFELTEEATQRYVYLDGQCGPSRQYNAFIDDLDCDARIKRVLRECLKRTATIGRKVLRIGRIVFDFILKEWENIKRRFPNTAAAIMIAVILKVIISSMPFIGFILGAVVAPIYLLVVIGVGLLKDCMEALRPVLYRYFGMVPAAAN